MTTHLAEGTKNMGLIDIQDSLVLVIDAQENFYRDHRTDVDRDTLADVFEKVAWVVGAAKALGVPTVVTRRRRVDQRQDSWQYPGQLSTRNCHTAKACLFGSGQPGNSRRDSPPQGVNGHSARPGDRHLRRSFRPAATGPWPQSCRHPRLTVLTR